MQKTGIKISPVNMKARQALKLRAGDTVRVWQNIVELKSGKGANKKEVVTKNTRKQAFEGTVLAVKHGTEPGATFTVRRIASGVGVEKIFPLYSPIIDSIELVRRARVRRAKLYFIRRKAARDVKRAMRRQLAVAPLVQDAAEDIVPAADAEPAVAEVPTQADLTGEVQEISSETVEEEAAKAQERVE